VERRPFRVTHQVRDFADRQRGIGQARLRRLATRADDAIELPPCQPVLRGRGAVEQYLRGLFDEAKVTAFTFAHLESTVDGRLAYDVGTYQQQLSLSSGQRVTATGKYLVLLRRAGRGWKTTYVIYTPDAPMPCDAPRG
jgi:ketosteroid isomerase-like protein